MGIRIEMMTGVGNTKYSYEWSMVDQAHVTEGKEITNHRGDVDFLLKNGTRIIHPRCNILKLEIEP